MSIIDTLITDRTEADVQRWSALKAKGWSGMTDDEKAEWAASLKGSYNYTDLNRVTQAMDYLNERLAGYGYQTGYQRVEVPHQQEPVSPLPDGYTQLAWIESSGTQYVDTGFAPNQNTRVILDAYLSKKSSGATYFIGLSQYEPSAYYQVRIISAAQYITSDFGTDTKNFPELPAGRYVIDKNKNVCTIGTSVVTNTSNTFQSVSNLLLFSSTTTAGVNAPSPGMIYSCKVYDNDVLIRDFIPCLNPSNEVGLYDTVNGQFYGNSGTGELIAGPVPVELPDGYTQVEYIQSSGTQYIDTDFKPDQDTKIIIDAEIISEVLYGSIFGARNSSSSGQFNLWPASSQQWRYDYGTSASLMVSASSTGRHIFTADGPDVSIDEQSQAYGQQTFQTNNNLYLLTINLGGSTGEKCNAKVYSCQVYDTGSLIRNYVPVINPSGVAGLYDLIGSQFYANAGTGTFSVGSTVEPPPSPPTYEELDPYTWYEEDIPTISLMETYLDNVTAIRAVLELLPTTPETPESMEALTWVEANNIEQILVDVETVINRVVNGMARSNSFTFWSGNRPFPTAESNLGRNWAELDAMNTEWKNWEVATWYLLLYGNLEAEGVVT